MEAMGAMEGPSKSVLETPLLHMPCHVPRGERAVDNRFLPSP